MTPPPAAAAPGRLEYFREQFTPAETAVLERFFTNTTEPVFALINLPEVVKGALFARYSRTTGSLRRLFLDEFYEVPEVGIAAVAERLGGEDQAVRLARAEALYQKVFTEFGDDSVAQLGGAHLACEQASNLLTKVLERGRLASYLEQSTRYVRFDRPLGGRYRYLVPPEIADSSLAAAYRETLDGLFAAYSRLVGALEEHYRARYPRAESDAEAVYRASIRARAYDDLRGLLPAATLSNLGIYASGQAFEGLLLRMRAHPLAEAREYGERMLAELRRVIPAFVRRVDLPERGGAWSRYLADTAHRVEEMAARLAVTPEPRAEVTLVDWDPDAELKVAAAALYPHTDLPDDQLLDHVRRLPAEEVVALLVAYVGRRENRRHKPGRGMERVSYRFDVLCDYGIFRDLQRHRLLTIDWQRLGTAHGFVTPPSLAEAGGADDWQQGMERAAALHARLASALGVEVAQYAVPFAYRIRFYVQLSAREAFHMLELRTQPGGHPGYRRVCAEMHRLIGEQAGHRRLAAAMSFVDHGEHGLERLDSERRAAARRATAAAAADGV
jgi:thymidylate synthase ThyX